MLKISYSGKSSVKNNNFWWKVQNSFDLIGSSKDLKKHNIKWDKNDQWSKACVFPFVVKIHKNQSDR